MDEIFSLIADRIARAVRDAQRAAAQEQARQQAAAQALRGSGPGATQADPGAPFEASNVPGTATRPPSRAQPMRSAPGMRTSPGAQQTRATPPERPAPPEASMPARRAASALERQLAAFVVEDAFPTQLEDGAAAPASDAASKRSVLLGAFAGRAPLLAAIVLGEALAPPIALRPREPRY